MWLHAPFCHLPLCLDCFFHCAFGYSLFVGDSQPRSCLPYPLSRSRRPSRHSLQLHWTQPRHHHPRPDKSISRHMECLDTLACPGQHHVLTPPRPALGLTPWWSHPCWPIALWSVGWGSDTMSARWNWESYIEISLSGYNKGWWQQPNCCNRGLPGTSSSTCDDWGGSPGRYLHSNVHPTADTYKFTIFDHTKKSWDMEHEPILQMGSEWMIPRYA
jgi:hypothetical protein